MTEAQVDEGGSKPLRLFVAVPIPERAANAVEAALEPWRQELTGVRWMPRENWHVTLRFLGSTSPGLLPEVRRGLELAAARTSWFETGLGRLGVFPSTRHARVLWAGFDDPAARFADLAGGIDDSLRGTVEPDARPFTPHVTVGRSRSGSTDARGFARTPLGPDRFRVEEIVLMRSHLRRPAPVYERIGVYPLLHRGGSVLE